MAKNNGKNSTTEQKAAPEIPANLRARTSLSDVQDDLKAEYIKPANLATLGRFNITGAYVRTGEFGEECAFEVQIVEPGEMQGASGTVTFKETPVRRKLVDVVRKRGVIGPVILAPVGENKKGSQPWGFVDPAVESAAPIQ